MKNPTVEFTCIEGEARAYPNWSPFGAEYFVLQEGESGSFYLVAHTAWADTREAVGAGEAKLKELMREYWQAASIGCNDSGPFSVVDGKVAVKNTSAVAIEVTQYNEVDPWDYDSMDAPEETFTLQPGESREAVICHSNAQTFWVRKLDLEAVQLPA